MAKRKYMMRILDALLVLPVIPAALILKLVRRLRVENLPLAKRVLCRVGVFPLIDHYYEPMFDYRNFPHDFDAARTLPGLDLNVSGQFELLEKLVYQEEIAILPKEKIDSDLFYMNNGSFGPGDAEYYYQIIRATRPRKIIEIGSGYSTLIALKAIGKNQDDDASYQCSHICIEPYERLFLEDLPVSLIRERVEDVDLSVFQQLEENDILFIDSSHVIRPNGDVLHEYLEVLPVLNRGVIVQVHDIFTPCDYPIDWLRDRVRFWNEQYLLEALLTQTDQWEVIAALNFLHHNYFEKFSAVAPFALPETNPGSFYIVRK